MDRLRGDEAGAIAIIYVVLLLAMLGLAALTVDASALRHDRRGSQSVADLAATAGAANLIGDLGGSPQAACVEAFRYALANLGIDDTPPYGCDAVFPSDFSSCDPANPLTLTLPSATTDPYAVTVQWPVDDTDPLMQDKQPVDELDGDPCQRIGMTITRTRGFIFGPVIGTASGATGATAVALGFAGGNTPEIASLVLLDRFGCDALKLDGGGSDPSRIWVRTAKWDHDDDPNTPEIDLPGIITVDSQGLDSSSRCSTSMPYVIDVQNNAVTYGIKAGVIDDAGSVAQGLGIIYSNAMYSGNDARAYHQLDVDGGLLVPKPVAGKKITRAPIDHRYNCKAEYSLSDPDGAYAIEPCKDADGTNLAHIDNLRDWVDGQAALKPTPYDVPPGWGDYRQFVADKYGLAYNKTCAPNLTTVVVDDPAVDKWWVACPSGQGSDKGLNIGGGNSIVFTHGDVVFDGSVEVGSNGHLSVNDGTGQNATVVIRNDHLKVQGQLTLDSTFLYLQDATTEGYIYVGAGGLPVTWTAPDDDTFDFDDLALWSDGTGEHALGGQANLDIEGVFFIPQAQFVYTGQGIQAQKKAQFITWRMNVKSQAKLEITPDPSRAVAIPVTGVRLIR